jgi:hypothetical protein
LVSSSASCSGDIKVNTENVVKHLRVLLRTDRIIADIRMRHLLVGLGLRAFAAARPPSGRELDLANEIHGSSVEALQHEARALQSQVSGVIHHPLNGILPLLLVPLITIIIKSLKKPKAATAPEKTSAADQK